ncbi:MAG TPA: hypothetical protein PLF26_06930 [Blastocatellia bacterium]|nr:hypothetical protein [Blastocatellia bacterium]
MKRAIERFVLLGVLAGCCAVTAAAQSIPRGFEAAVAAETADGVKLVASAETTTYAGTYMAAVYQLPESDKDDSGYQRLKVHFLPPGAVMVRTMSLYTEAHVGLGTYEDGDTVFTDINNDGKIELIASVANGGNCWNCSQVLIYALDGPDLRWLAAEPMTISDVTGDGVPDLLVGDTRWESYGNFSHAGAPGGTMVYKWDSGRYVFAGAEASGFYNSMLDRIRADLPDAIKQINADDALSDEMYVGDAISMYLIAVYTGRFEAGRAEFTKMMGEYVKTDDMRRRRNEVLKDFLSGESSKLLETPRRGQPLEKPSKIGG